MPKQLTTDDTVKVGSLYACGECRVTFSPKPKVLGMRERDQGDQVYYRGSCPVCDTTQPALIKLEDDS